MSTIKLGINQCINHQDQDCNGKPNRQITKMSQETWVITKYQCWFGIKT